MRTTSFLIFIPPSIRELYTPESLSSLFLYDFNIVEEVEEVMSWKRAVNRPALIDALTKAEKYGYTILVGKLERLF